MKLHSDSVIDKLEDREKDCDRLDRELRKLRDEISYLHSENKQDKLSH